MLLKKKQNISKLPSFGIYNYGSNSRLTIMKWVRKIFFSVGVILQIFPYLFL
jgi:hypothetical protein